MLPREKMQKISLVFGIFGLIFLLAASLTVWLTVSTSSDFVLNKELTITGARYATFLLPSIIVTALSLLFFARSSRGKGKLYPIIIALTMSLLLITVINYIQVQPFDINKFLWSKKILRKDFLVQSVQKSWIGPSCVILGVVCTLFSTILLLRMPRSNAEEARSRYDTHAKKEEAIKNYLEKKERENSLNTQEQNLSNESHREGNRKTGTDSLVQKDDDIHQATGVSVENETDTLQSEEKDAVVFWDALDLGIDPTASAPKKNNSEE